MITCFYVFTLLAPRSSNLLSPAVVSDVYVFLLEQIHSRQLLLRDPSMRENGIQYYVCLLNHGSCTRLRQLGYDMHACDQ